MNNYMFKLSNIQSVSKSRGLARLIPPTESIVNKLIIGLLPESLIVYIKVVLASLSIAGRLKVRPESIFSSI